MCTSLPRLSTLVIITMCILTPGRSAPQFSPSPVIPTALFPKTIIAKPIITKPIIPKPLLPIRVYPDEDIPTPYEYEYKVENAATNTYYGKNELGDGAGTVTGSYYVYLPDGRLMTVDYSADAETGFVPRVSFSSQTTYPGVVVPRVI